MCLHHLLSRLLQGTLERPVRTPQYHSAALKHYSSAEREGRPSGESWRCRGKIPGGQGGQQSAGCRKTYGRGAKRTQILDMGCSTPRLTPQRAYLACRRNGRLSNRFG